MTLSEERPCLPTSLSLGTLKFLPAPPKPVQNAGLAMQACHASYLGRLTTMGQEDYSLEGCLGNLVSK